MKYLVLINAGLWRRPLRTILTILAVMVAFLLFGLMHGIVSSFDSALDQMSATRLRVMARANLLETIPLAYRQRLTQVEGVGKAVPLAIFVGYYQDPINGVTGGGLDIEGLLDVMPEFRIPAEQLDVLMQTRTGMVAGAALAEQYDWTLGQRIGLQSMLWLNEDTGVDWFFDLVAIANAGPDDERGLFANQVFFHYDYLDESRSTGKGRVHQFVLSIDDPTEADRIATDIDALFANSSDETSTVDEKQFIQNQLRQLGDVQSFVYYVLAAVLFTLLFLTATNMMQSLRERVSELGIMRALGFGGALLAALIFVESLLLSVTGALLGLAVAGGVFPDLLASFSVGMQLGIDVYLLGITIAVAIAIAASAWPAWRASSVDVVTAIAGGRRG